METPSIADFEWFHLYIDRSPKLLSNSHNGGSDLRGTVSQIMSSA